MSRSNFLDENYITELRGGGTQPRTGAAARIATATRVRPTGAAAPTTLRARQEHRQTTRPHCSGERNSLSEILSTPIIVVPSLNNLSAERYLMYNVQSIAIGEFNLRTNKAHGEILNWIAPDCFLA